MGAVTIKAIRKGIWHNLVEWSSGMAKLAKFDSEDTGVDLLVRVKEFTQVWFFRTQREKKKWTFSIWLVVL